MTPPATHHDDSGIGEARRQPASETSTPPKTLRDDFAMAIIQGTIASPRVFVDDPDQSIGATTSLSRMVDIAYLGADLMLQRRLQ